MPTPTTIENPAAPRIRQLMPDGFLRTIAERTGCTQRATLSGVVNYEQTSSKYWPAVEQLARETNPDGFAEWQAAQLQPVAAGA
ncbi:hypothetical protein LJ737_04425 [Hymenobacter sp. 15J16-1T3B]|uniref:hypothetical protein n=1 Tax=Hymenobacter sp. 15J16-1T3B TaxID=2886941 RepID=UPI001D0FED7C|nr:hypothetical protein [Hymenobacter sp. 15J16-1T3B]MCC3156469.1 hypothetical protein [Hymenobacter sp. 15J16-1T3B]